MDALSHLLLGFIIGQALRLDPSLQLVLMVSSVSLDIDALSIRSPEAAFRTHRGPLHSILAAIVASLLISTGYIIFMGLPTTTFLPVITISLAGLLSHVFLDAFTTGSLIALWPFSRRNFTLNLAHFLDPTFPGALLSASLIIVYMKTNATAIQLAAGSALAFLTLSFGARYYLKSAAIRIVKVIDDGARSEVVALPTIRPDRWWTVRKTPFDSGYCYEIYRVDSVRNKVLSKDIVESPHSGYNGAVELPIDSPRKAIACSRNDKRISATVGRFALPAVNTAPSSDNDTWHVFWYDA